MNRTEEWPTSLDETRSELMDMGYRRTGEILFLSDAGGVGLNLQHAASCCVNLELPWNPAVLEQRIGRIYRMGQTRPIDVYNFVNEYGIEARIATLVSSKKALFSGLFDGASDEIRFDGKTSFLADVERLIGDVPGPAATGPGTSVSAEAEAEAEGESDVERETSEDESDLMPSLAAESGSTNGSSRHVAVPDMPGSHIQPEASPSPSDETRVNAEADSLAAISPYPKPESSANPPLPQMRLDTPPAAASSIGQLFGRISARRPDVRQPTNEPTVAPLRRDASPESPATP